MNPPSTSPHAGSPPATGSLWCFRTARRRSSSSWPPQWWRPPAPSTPHTRKRSSASTSKTSEHDSCSCLQDRAASVGLNYILTALGMSYVRRTPVWTTIFENVGTSTLVATVALSFSGGILFLLLQTPVGYIMAPGLFAFVLAVRGNVADAQRQTELKDQTLALAAQALDARDRYTESHSIRVADLAARMGDYLELGDLECDLLRTAGSLHDLGKIGIRDDILNKAGPLTDEEWVIMKRHPDIGADMIAQHAALAEVAPLVRHHHERWDGT